MPIRSNPLVAVGTGALVYAASKNKSVQKLAGNVAKVAAVAAVGKKILGAIDATAARLAGAGLERDATTRLGENEVNVTYSNARDWRFRVSVGEGSGIFYKSTDPGILAPLVQTRGVIFPYNPQISINYVNNYSALSPVHSINSIQAFVNSDVSSISVTGNFSAQNESDADYVMAVIHFFRSASKMFFGESTSGNAGNPPPLLFLNGYGPQYLNNVSCVLTSFSHSMPDDVDFIPTSEGTMIPTFSSISLTFIPQYSRAKVSQFNLDTFASGGMLDKGFI